MVRNSLSTEFRSLSVRFGDFRRMLKTIIIRAINSDISALSAIEMLSIILRYINFLFYSILFYTAHQCKKRKHLEHAAYTTKLNKRILKHFEVKITLKITLHFTII